MVSARDSLLVGVAGATVIVSQVTHCEPGLLTVESANAAAKSPNPSVSGCRGLKSSAGGWEGLLPLNRLSNNSVQLLLLLLMLDGGWLLLPVLLFWDRNDRTLQIV